jgi:mRNA-decapping enzyme subunit 2
MATKVSNRSKTPSSRVPVHILDDLSSKFLINLPDAEKNDLIRLFFQIELAHWFFLDFYCTQEENSIYSCGIKQFALCIFEHIPFLNHHSHNLNTLLEEWRSYKMSVPTYGAILLTADLRNCLLVQSFFAKNSWSYPKGKVNENEDPCKCAVREVYEETGYDCSQLISDIDFIEGQTSNYQYTRLYVVKNVPIETKFCPRTRNEIKDCAWFTVDELPTTRSDDGYFKDQRKIRANSFYMILPFISKLKHWIANERLAQVIGNKGKREQKGKHSNKKTSLFVNKMHQKQQQQLTNHSPYFPNNNINNINNNADYNRNLKARHKSAGDILDSNSPSTSGTFYNDNLKLQNNTSTPINGHQNQQPLMPSSSSAFRATNNISSSFKKKLHLQKSNGKTNGTANVQQQQQQQQPEQIKRRLFSEAKENMRPQQNTVKPFAFDIPESWKNFKFDHQKIFDCM